MKSKNQDTFSSNSWKSRQQHLNSISKPPLYYFTRKESIMNCGAILFKQQVPFVIELEGKVDGLEFSVRGKGHGDANTGKIEMKFISTTGDLPVPWSSLASSLGYGALCFTKYPNGINDFFKSCMPEGYIQERTISFEGDGVYKTRAEVTFENGSVYNRVKLNGEGFKEDGNILGKKLDFSSQASSMVVVANKEDRTLNTRFHVVYNVIGGGVQIASYSQTNSPLSNGPVIMPEFHHIRSVSTLSKDHKEKFDNLHLVEIHTASELKD